MRAKRVVPLLALLFTFSIFTCTTKAAITANSISFQGVGVTIDLTFPTEAHPTENITHNVTITAETDLTLENFTIVIWAQTDSTLVHVKNQTLPTWPLTEDEILTYRLGLTLTQNQNATIRCFIHVKTTQSSDYSSFTFYTTRVQQLSYGELLVAYNELMANRSMLITEYANLLNDYNELLSDNALLVSSQQTLQNDYNEFAANYTNLLASHRTLENDYNISEDRYNNLFSEHQSLQLELADLRGNYTDLKDSVDALQEAKNQYDNNIGSNNIVILILIIAVAGLVALIAYIKRKKQEPYLVIRKETVALDKDAQ